MAIEVVELKGKVDDIKQKLEDARRALRDLKREQKSGGKVTDEQREKLVKLKETVEDLRDEGKKLRLETRKGITAARADIKIRKELAKANQELITKTKTLIAVGAVAAVAAGKAIKAAAEQQRVERELAFAFQTTGQTRVEALKSVSAATAVFAQNQKETIFGDEEQARALALIIRTTNDRTKAQERLTQAMDLASLVGEDLALSSKRIAEAVTGDLGPLKELGILTAEQVKEFNKIKDPAERAARAFEIVAKETKGARLEVGELSQTLAQLENDTGDVLQSLGELISALAQVSGAADGTGSIIGDFASDISTGAKGIVELSDNLSTVDKVLLALTIPLAAVTGPFGFALLDAQIESAGEKAASFMKKSEGIAARVSAIVRPFEESDAAQPGVTTRGKRPGLSFKTLQDLAGIGPEDKKKPSRKATGAGGFDFDAAEVEEFEEQIEQQRIELELLREKDELKRLELEHELALMELRGTGLTDQQEEMAIAIELQLFDERKLELARESIDRQIVFNRILEEEKESQAALLRTSKERADVEADREAKTARGKDLEVIKATAGAVSGLAAAVVEGEAAKAAIKVLMALGEVGLNLASLPPNIPGAIAAAGAAAKFTAAAALGGKSAGGKGGGGSVGGGGAAVSQFDPRELQRENARLLGEELRRGTGGPSGATNIQIDFRHVGKITHEEAREVTDAVQSEMGNRR